MSRQVFKRDRKAAVEKWEIERSLAAGLSGLVEDILIYRARGTEPLGGWHLLWDDLEATNASYIQALEESPDFYAEEEE